MDSDVHSAGSLNSLRCSVCEEETIPGCSFKMHYNVYCCEACKCFFRRSIQLNKIFSCKFVHQCIISHKVSRHFCKACRLRKCIRVGMKIEAVKCKRNVSGTNYRSNQDSEQFGTYKKFSIQSSSDVLVNTHSVIFSKKELNLFDNSSGSEINDEIISSNQMGKKTSIVDSSYLKYDDEIFRNGYGKMDRSECKFKFIDTPNELLMTETCAESINRTSEPLETKGKSFDNSNPNNFQFPLTTQTYENQHKPDDIYEQNCENLLGPLLLANHQYDIASIEEVLDSLKFRILDLFKWSKKSLEFCKLSQNDQKSLLRSNVVELAMLGFARASIHYDNALYFNHINKIILPFHPNSAVACVTKLTIEKLVIPLRYLHLNRCEYRIMKEIILYNADSAGLGHINLVRTMRRARYEELFLATGTVGRFGEILSLLTPLFEVATEITEQLRLEQYVQESEATMDAFLLISLLQEVEEVES